MFFYFPITCTFEKPIGVISFIQFHIERKMLPLKTRFPFNTTRMIVATAMIMGREQKRYTSLTMETLNPLVKEVEYAVRGRQYTKTVQSSDRCSTF